MQTFNKFVGIKFEYGKSSFESCDCWGLVCLFYKEHFGIDLKHNKQDFEEDISIEQAINRKEKVLKNLIEVEADSYLRDGDIFLYENAQGKPHVAVHIRGHFLETFEKSNSILRKSTKFTHLIEKKVYRHKDFN